MASLQKALIKLASHNVLDICTIIHMEAAIPLLARLKNLKQANMIMREIQASQDNYIKGKLLLVHDTDEMPEADDNADPQYTDYMNEVLSYEMRLHKDLKENLRKVISEDYQQNRCPLDNLVTAQKSITQINAQLTEIFDTAPRLAILENK